MRMAIKRSISELKKLALLAAGLLISLIVAHYLKNYLPKSVFQHKLMPGSQQNPVGMFRWTASKRNVFTQKGPDDKKLNQTVVSQTTPRRERKHTIAIPPLTPAELSANRIDLNIDRVFTFTESNTRNEHLSPTKTIPKTLHFMWTNETIPSVFIKNIKSFLFHNPSWTVYFWTYQLVRMFIVEHYPHLLYVFDGYKANVSKSDMSRLVIIYHYGGAYFDLDTRCLKSLDPLIETENCIVSAEPLEHAVIILNMPSLLNTCIIMCRPGHKFFKYAISRLRLSNKDRNIMTSAGPIFFTRAFHAFVAVRRQLNLDITDTIRIASSELFLDRIKENIKATLKSKCSRTATADLNVAVCKHWQARGGQQKEISNRSFTDHQYFGTYSNMRRLRFTPEGHFRQVIPGVKTYTPVYPFKRVRNTEE